MNGMSFQTPPQRSYGKRPREDDGGSSGRSYRRRGNDEFPGSAGSFNRRSGGRGRDDHFQGPSPIRPIDRFRQDLWKFGDEDSPAFGLDSQSLLAAARHAEDMFNRYREDLCDGFRIAVTELPHKLAHYACILSLMDHKAAASLADIDGPTAASAGHAVVGHLIKAFQSDLLERKWVNVRLLLQFFAHLASLPRPLVTVTSLLATIRSFAAVTEEFGVGANRADESTRIALEALLRLAVDADVGDIVAILRNYIESRKTAHDFLRPAEQANQYDDPVNSLFYAFTEGGRVSVAPTPEKDVIDQLSITADWSSSPHELPTVVVPLDVEAENAPAYAGTRIELKLFNDDTVPPRSSPDGVYLRCLISTAIDVYEVNRKDAAKYLLELPRWLAPNIFKPKAGAKVEDDIVLSTWIHEHIVVETVLSSLFALPRPRHPLAYYASLIIEMCKLSPATVAPAMGKCVRRLYAGLGEEPSDDVLAIDAEGARRFGEWFSVHLSNFGYTWRWTEWQDDLVLPALHPKRALINRILELETRLSYFDRIKEPLPDAFKSDTIMAADAPTAHLAFEEIDHPRHTAAMSVLEHMKGKSSVDDVRSELRVFRETLQEQEAAADPTVATAELTLQCIFSIGSRSFSHLLNVFERYIELIRELSTTHETRRILLEQVFQVWKQYDQYLLIVVDKLLQYRIIEARDLLEYILERRSWSNFMTWDLLRCVLTKAHTRTEILQSRLDAAIQSNEDADKLHEQRDAARKDAEESLVLAAQRLAGLYAGDSDKMQDGENGDERWVLWWNRGWFREFTRSYATSLGALTQELATAVPVASSSARDLLIEGTKQWGDFVGRA